MIYNKYVYRTGSAGEFESANLAETGGAGFPYTGYCRATLGWFWPGLLNAT
jgi:hypothetical protein